MVAHSLTLKPDQERNPGADRGVDAQKRGIEGNLAGAEKEDVRAALLRRATTAPGRPAAATDAGELSTENPQRVQPNDERLGRERERDVLAATEPKRTPVFAPSADLLAVNTDHRAGNVVHASQPHTPDAPRSESHGFFGGVKDFVFGAGKLLGDATSFVVDKGVAGVKAVGKFAVLSLSDPAAALEQAKDAAVAVGHGVATAVEYGWKGVKAVGSFVGEHGWSALKWCGNLLASPIKGCFYLGQSIGEGVVDVGSFLLGQKSWSEVSQNFSSNIGKAGAEFARPWHLVKGLSDSLGLTDVIVGVGHIAAIAPHLLWDAGKVLTGQGSFADLKNHFVGHLVGAKDGVVGGVKLLGEVTGVTDLFLAGKHSCQAVIAYGRGDMAGVAIHSAQAAMHGTFAALSAGSIAATVATAGAAGASVVAVVTLRQSAKEAAKVVLKEASKQFFKEASKEIGEVALKKVSSNATEVLSRRYGPEAVLQAVEKHAGQELAQAVGKEARQAVVDKAVMKELLQREAREGGRDVLKEISKRGPDAISKEAFEQVSREIGEKRTVALLKELKADTIVKDEVLPLLKNAAESNPKKFAATLTEKFGLSKGEAKDMAKEVQRCLKKGKSDDEIKALLEEGISKPFSAKMAKEMEQPFKDTIRSGLKGEMPDVFGREMVEAVEKKAAKLGKDVNKFIDELTESAWKGYREGIERAIKSVVREGIEKAFKEFRQTKSRAHLHGGAGVGAEVVEHDEKIVRGVDFKAEPKEHATKQEPRLLGTEEAYQNEYVTTDGVGNPIRVRTRLNPTDNHIEVSIERLGNAKERQEKAA